MFGVGVGGSYFIGDRLAEELPDGSAYIYIYIYIERERD